MTIEQPSGAYIEVEPGVELYYREVGRGTPLIFVPGWTFTGEVFHHQLDHFARTHRVIALDPRSHGRSSIVCHGNDYITHAADLAKFIKALDLTDVVLIGWSFGCLATWGYVRQEGLAALKAMVCIDLSPKPLSAHEGDWVEGPLDEIAGAYHTFLRSRQGHRDFIAHYADEVMVQRELTPAEMTWIIEQSLRTPTPIAAALFASGMFSNCMEAAKQVDASLPALAVIAEHWAETATAFMRSHFPNTRTAVLGGHMMFWEHPAEFNRLLEEFLATV
ncbi:MAG: alpha/beta hydrolase [Caldilinea sp.]|nr:alpha/beta hydrolase [Caldilinea sp.]MDW8439840.1 alpha/beta hydrolase [Caldilineaceae bacterium]